MKARSIRTYGLWLVIGSTLVALLIAPLALPAFGPGPTVTDVVAWDPKPPPETTPTPWTGGGASTNGFAWGG